MKKYALLLIVNFVLLINCRQKELQPTQIIVDSTGINLGSIKAFTEIKTSNLVLDKVSDGSVSWIISTDRSWIKPSRNAGIISVKDTIKFMIETHYLNFGDNFGNIILTPTVDKIVKNAIKIPVRINSSAFSVVGLNDYTLLKDEEWKGYTQMKGNITIPKGKTLTIKEGTSISITEKARFIVQGSLLIKGTSSNIVRLFAENISSGQTAWNGIAFFGEKLEMSYCSISDMTNGVFIYANSTSANTKIERCLFSNGETAVTDFSSNNNVLMSFNTFFSLKYGYWQLGENKKVTIENCVFDTNTNSSIYLLSNNPNDPKPTTVTITTSNFIREGIFSFIGISVPFNTSVLAENSFGLVGNYGLSPQRGNSMIIKNPANTAIKDIGCGFEVVRNGRK